MLGSSGLTSTACLNQSSACLTSALVATPARVVIAQQHHRLRVGLVGQLLQPGQCVWIRLDTLCGHQKARVGEFSAPIVEACGSHVVVGGLIGALRHLFACVVQVAQIEQGIAVI